MSKEKSVRPGYKKITFGRVLSTIIVILGAVTMLVPYIWMILTTFKTNTECYATTLKFLPEKFLLDSYIDIFSKKEFYTSIKNTLIIEVSVILVGTIVSSLAAFAFAKLKMRFRKTLLLVLMSSMMIPYAAVMLPQYRAFQEVSMTDTLWPLILPGLFGNISLMFFLITYMKSGIADSIIESAKIDGCSYLAMWKNIALPLAKPAIATQVVFWFIGIWNDYFGPSIYLTSTNKMTLQVFIVANSTAESGTNFPAVMAGAFLASLPMIIIFFCFQDYFINSIAMTGSKED